MGIIRVSTEVEEYFKHFGKFGETHDAVLRRRLIDFDQIPKSENFSYYYPTSGYFKTTYAHKIEPRKDVIEEIYKNDPKVSCCMVTYNRFELAKMSIQCYLNQTYENKELIIVTDGPISYQNELKDYIDSLKRKDILLKCFKRRKTLGKLRNISLDNCNGELYCQWDDDDLNHPDRIAVQVKYMIDNNAGASFMEDQLHYYWNGGELYWEHWQHKNCEEHYNWIPGTIIMKLGKIRYPEKGEESKRGEDVVLRTDLWNSNTKVVSLKGLGYLNVYSFHGNKCLHENTFNESHHSWLSNNLKLKINKKSMKLVQDTITKVGLKFVNVKGVK